MSSNSRGSAACWPHSLPNTTTASQAKANHTDAANHAATTPALTSTSHLAGFVANARRSRASPHTTTIRPAGAARLAFASCCLATVRQRTPRFLVYIFLFYVLIPKFFIFCGRMERQFMIFYTFIFNFVSGLFRSSDYQHTSEGWVDRQREWTVPKM